MIVYFYFLFLSLFLLASEDLIALTVSSNTVITEKSIVVVIPSRNNEMWCEKNLISVFSQKYTNYRIILIDDCSTDQTMSISKNCINKHEQQFRTTVISNKTRKGALHNLYDAIHSCSSNEIILMLDGDDWLKNDFVLETINNVYKDSNVWLTWGQFEYHTGEIGISRPLPQEIIKQNNYRNYYWVTSHLRTCYAKLFKQIKKEDLMYKGLFLEYAWDLAIMYPMLEMSQYHSKFIPDILYVYNRIDRIDSKQTLDYACECDRYVRSLPKYRALSIDQFNSLK